MSRLSGVQQDVLSLYRRILREAIKKDRLELQNFQMNSPKSMDGSHTVTTSPNSQRVSFLELQGTSTNNASKAAFAVKMVHHTTTTSYAIQEFRRQALSVQRSDFKKIDYMIRKGDKQIKLLRMPGVKLVSSTTTTTSASPSKS